jgi:hypothetical protein
VTRKTEAKKKWAWLLPLFTFSWWLLGWLQLRSKLKFAGRGDDAPVEQQDPREPDCMRIPPTVYRRPDPMIYSQKYLMSQGLAVTWDNPDIHLELAGVPVPSSSLTANTEYDVIARIWNGSTRAPAMKLPIQFSYLSFGIGAGSTAIAEDHVDLPVNGASGHPTYARVKWRTPPTPGHYCLQVEAIWTDDENPANNLGQSNTTVKALNSPNATFVVPVRNPTRWDQAVRLEVDGYSLPTPPDCDPHQTGSSVDMTPAEIDRHRRDSVARHGRSGHPVPPGWRIVVDPQELVLHPGQQHEVTVSVTSPDGFAGRRGFNVNGFVGGRPLGGVTLYVEGTGV